MSAMDRRDYLRSAGALAALGLAGCLAGGDGGGSGGGGDGDPYGDWLDDASGDTAPVDRTGRERVTVEVGAGDGFAFAPAAVEVSPDTTVVWEWVGMGGQHNVLHVDGAFQSEFAGTAGHTFEHRFGEPGVSLYYCSPHRSLGMKGAVRVVE